MTQQIATEPFAGNPAVNYERYFVPVIGAPSAQALVGAARVSEGERVLDVACGTGIVARLAAERNGGAAVAGVDINPGMLAVAREAAGEGIEWHEASADALPLADETFDVALCGIGLQFFPDPTAALRELHRVLVPGGRVALNVPGPTPPLFQVLEDVLRRRLGPDAGAFVATVFRLHEPAEVRGLLENAGFADANAASRRATLPAPPAEEFLWQYVYSTPLAAAARELDDDARAAVQREVVAGWQPFAEDGGLRLEVDITIATAQKR